MREALEKAFDEAEESTEAIEATEESVDAVEAPDTEISAPDEPDDGTVEPSDAPISKALEEKAQEEPSDAVESAQDIEMPRGLDAAAREVWGDSPKALQDWVVKRQEQFERDHNEMKEGADRAKAMAESIAPYQQLFVANNVPPGQMIGNLLQTASGLQFGTPQQKAQIAAQIIRDFGVDIESLAQVIEGNVPRETQPQMSVEQAIDQRFQQYEQNMANQQRAHATDAATRDLEEFARTHEFYNELSGDMAMMFDNAQRTGIPITLEDAYNRSLLMHPELQGILTAREDKANHAARAAAASSISGSPGGEPAPSNAPRSIRDNLEANWPENVRL